MTLRIGLYGGSFNPAHPTHLRISRLALARLGLDQVWWLVSPQNPLKTQAGMAPFAERFAGAKRLTAGDPRIVVSDLEARLGTRYSIDTMRALKRRFPRLSFVWIMGADILAEMPRWKRWRELLGLMPIVVFHRPGFAAMALGGPAAARLRRHRKAARVLADARAPAWQYCWASRSDELATDHRRNGQNSP